MFAHFKTAATPQQKTFISTATKFLSFVPAATVKEA